MKTLTTVVLQIFLAIFILSSCEKKIEVQKYGTISGVVLNDSSNIPLANARITTTPASNVVLTDSNGTFVITGVPEGETSVKAEKHGYKSESISVRVSDKDSAKVIFLLKSDDDPTTDTDIIENPVPADAATDIDIDTTLSWSFSGKGSDVTFDVFLYPSNSTVQKEIATDIGDTSVPVSGLDYATTYFWYVVSTEDGIQTSISDVWSFTTADFPDNHLVFAREINSSFEILSSGLAGEDVFQLSNDPGRDWNPALGPFLNKIAFTSDRVLDFQLYHINRDGSQLTQVTNLPIAGYHNYGLGYCWAPNGGGFLYSHYDKLYYINKDGSSLTSVMDTAPAGRNWRELDWNATTQKIVAQSIGVNIYDSEIYLMNEDGSNAQLLVPNDAGRTDHPVFSTDGSKILYTHDAQGYDAASGRQLDARIYLLDIGTMTVTDLSYDKPAGTNDLMPEFSPNNAQILFVNEDNTGTATPEIWQMDIDGKNRVKLIENASLPHAR